MRKLYPMLAVAVLFAGASLLVRAADDGQKVSITGEAQCAKCALKETAACQNVVVVKEGDKQVKYYLAKNDVANAAHAKLGFCQAKPGQGPKVKVEGTCKKEDDKLVVTATSIEKAE
jgi:hypothetical protein